MNSNILDGFACPNCGNDETLVVIASMSVRLTDDEGEAFGDQEWDDNSPMSCPECNYSGIVQDFDTDMTNFTVTYTNGDVFISCTVPAPSRKEAILTASEVLALNGVTPPEDAEVEVVV